MRHYNFGTFLKSRVIVQNKRYNTNEKRKGEKNEIEKYGAARPAHGPAEQSTWGLVGGCALL